MHSCSKPWAKLFFADLPDMVTIMAACVRELESLKPPPAGFVAWGLTGEIGNLSDHCCKHCREAVSFMRANQQSTEILCDFKRGSKQKLQHVAE